MQIELNRPAAIAAGQHRAALPATRRTDRPLISRRDLRRLVAQMID